MTPPRERWIVRVRRHRVAIALVALALVVIGPVVSVDTAQPASRLSLTAALTEHHTVDIGRYRHALGLDHATYRGKLRSDKAPGQPLLAVPPYALARLVGAPSASHLRVHDNLELWWVTLWSALLPFACLLALLWYACRQFAPGLPAVAVAVAFGFGSLLLPFAVNLFGHDLAALLGFGAWVALDSGPESTRRSLLGGFLAGAAVLVEYEAGIVAIVLLGYLLLCDRRRVIHFASGAVIPAVVLAGYQWRAFGAPWRTPSAFYSGVINGTSRGGYSIPTLHDVASVIGGSRGMWIGAPVALLGVGCALWFAVRGAARVRTNAIVGLAIFVPYLLLVAGWSGTPLLEEHPGPRYLIPALPFLAVPVAAAWERVRVIAIPLAVWGGLMAAAATWTQILVPVTTNPFTADRYRVQHHEFASTLWSMAFGRAGVFLYAASVAAIVAAFVGVVRGTTPTTETALPGRA
jgi:hypothetical protein